MPGAFAHMIAAEQARQAAESKGLHSVARSTLKYPQWLQAGTVGPDYPYLHYFYTSHDRSDSWANLMHCTRTGDVVRSGIQWLKEWNGDRNSRKFERATAWLSGYLSHVVFDASIHPVVRAIVGEYEENTKDHRVCEMYMDSFIFKETIGYDLVNDEWADYLRHTTDDSGGMDKTIKIIWEYMLKATYPNEYNQNRPDFDGWHTCYVRTIDAADNNSILFRHATAENGFLYINSEGIPEKAMTMFIEQAKTPKNNRFGVETMHYRDIFNFGVDNIVQYWTAMNAAIEGNGDISMPTLPNWNLDKGTIDPTGEGDATLWI